MNDKRERDIIEGLKTLAGKYAPDSILFASVTAVDTDALTCDVTTDDLITIPGVLLQSEEAADIDILLQPSIGSRVIIASMANSDDWMVLKCGQIDKISINSGKIIFNNGSNKGMVLLENVKQRLNLLEEAINDLKSVFASWTPVPDDGGAALKAEVSSWAAATLTETEDSDIENTDIQQ